MKMCVCCESQLATQISLLYCMDLDYYDFQFINGDFYFRENKKVKIN